MFNYILPIGLFCGCQFCIFPEPDKEMIERDFYYYHLDNRTTDLTSIVTESSTDSNSDSESDSNSDSETDTDIDSIENTSNSSSDRLIQTNIQMSNR